MGGCLFEPLDCHPLTYLQLRVHHEESQAWSTRDVEDYVLFVHTMCILLYPEHSPAIQWQAHSCSDFTACAIGSARRLPSRDTAQAESDTLPGPLRRGPQSAYRGIRAIMGFVAAGSNHSRHSHQRHRKRLSALPGSQTCQ